MAPRPPDRSARASYDPPVLLARVVGAHGIRGGLRLRILGDDPENILSSPALEFVLPDGSSQRHTIERLTPGKPGEVRVFLEGLQDRTEAEALRGAEIQVPRSALHDLPDGEFYWYELVGCEVFTESGERVGQVRELWETGPQDLLVICGTDGEDRLIPTARELVPEIDPKNRRITVVDLPGLLEPAHARSTRGDSPPSDEPPDEPPSDAPCPASTS